MSYLKDFYMTGKEESWLESHGKPCVPVMGKSHPEYAFLELTAFAGGFAGKFGRLSEKQTYVPSTVNKHVKHVNILLFKHATRVFYRRSFCSEVRSSTLLTENFPELKSTRLHYKLKQHKSIKEYLLRLFQDISDDPYTLKCVVHTFPTSRLTNLCMNSERMHMPRSEAGHRRNRNQR